MTLLDVFEVEKEGEKEAFKEDLPNRSQFSLGFGKAPPCLECSYGTKGRVAQGAVGFLLEPLFAGETTITVASP